MCAGEGVALDAFFCEGFGGGSNRRFGGILCETVRGQQRRIAMNSERALDPPTIKNWPLDAHDERYLSSTPTTGYSATDSRSLSSQPVLLPSCRIFSIFSGSQGTFPNSFASSALAAT